MLRHAIPVYFRSGKSSQLPRCPTPLSFYRCYDGKINRCRPILFNNLHEPAPSSPVDDPVWHADTREIQYAFNPVNTSHLQPEFPSFDFLNPDTSSNLPGSQHANPNHPPSVGVPWPTSLSHSFQSKHWESVEGTLATFLRETYPQNPWAGDHSGREYMGQLADSVVSFVVNVFPTCPPTRLGLLANMYGFVFILDDAVDLGMELQKGPTGGTLSKRGFGKVTSDVLDESPTLGTNLVESLRKWTSVSQHDHVIENFGDYLMYRVEDVGVEPVFRSVEYACNLCLTDDERGSLHRFSTNCAKHFALTNDLYSHAKEAVEMQNGKQSANTVAMLEGQNEMTLDAAKTIVRQLIWKTEQAIHGEYMALLKAHGEEDPRLRYAQSVIIALAGNMFYSATCGRYASAIEGGAIAAE